MTTLYGKQKLMTVEALGERDGFHCTYCQIPLVIPGREAESCDWIIREPNYEHCGCGLHNPPDDPCVPPDCWVVRDGYAWPTRDHEIPRSQGGPDTPENLVLACVSCNSQKSGRTPPEWLGL